MARPRPLDKFVWVEHESGKQRRVLRARLPSLSPQWKRIADPTKKTSAPADTEPSASPSDTGPPAAKKAVRKHPASEKE